VIQVDGPAPVSPYLYQPPAAPEPTATPFANVIPQNSFASIPAQQDYTYIQNQYETARPSTSAPAQNAFASVPPMFANTAVPEPFPVQLADESGNHATKRDEEQRGVKQRRNLIIILAIVAVLAIGAGVGIGLYLSNKSNNGGDGSNTGSSNSLPSSSTSSKLITSTTSTTLSSTKTATKTEEPRTTTTEAPPQPTQTSTPSPPKANQFKIKLNKTGSCLGPSAKLVDCSAQGTYFRE
ncbi:hypothetical protein HDU97_009564, partial [Phlyctochytrium planicorne]